METSGSNPPHVGCRAVQQTATSLSPVIFDQFVRGRANQVLLGFFVGLTLYAYVVMTAVPGDTAPIIGAAVATLLPAAALIGLLVLVYTTIDQMRPVNVLRQIHDRTLRTRKREIDLIRRTRRQEASPHPVSATYRSTTTGYVTRMDLARLAAALQGSPVRRSGCRSRSVSIWPTATSSPPSGTMTCAGRKASPTRYAVRW